jgi:hypothetical protein
VASGHHGFRSLSRTPGRRRRFLPQSSASLSAISSTALVVYQPDQAKRVLAPA